jgi:hypothetical protein
VDDFNSFPTFFVGKLTEKTQLPAHGHSKDLGKGLFHAIKKQLGLK